MLHQLVITLLLPLLSATTTVSGEPVVVKDPQPQNICYVLPARCQWNATGDSVND